MNLWKIAWRSIQQRPLTSTLTCLSMALGVALVVAVITTYAVVEESFNRNRSLGYHLIVGGKNGSKLELVMSTVFHIGRSDEPVPYTFYKEFLRTQDADGNEVVPDRARYVELAVPICLGDNFEGYRVVATLPAIFDFEFAPGKKYTFAEGRNFAADKSGWSEAVIGAEVARKTGLRLGDTFAPTHGVGDGGHVHEENRCTVVGILAPTGTPNDRALFAHMEGFFRMEGHMDEEEGDAAEGGAGKEKHDHVHEMPDEKKKVTAILVRYGGPEFAFYPENLRQTMADAAAGEEFRIINKTQVAQAAQPVRMVTELLDRFVAPTTYLLMGLTILTVIVAGIGVMVGIYNTMLGRRHEIAVMRALGASRATVMLVVLCESILLSLIGGAAGFVIGHGLVAAAAPWVVDYTGVTVGLFTFDWRSLIIVPGLVVLASIVGYVPALNAYRTDVVKGLATTG
jgi:putative ABC transport system permease protein